MAEGEKVSYCVRTGFSFAILHGRIIVCYRIMVRSCSNRPRIVVMEYFNRFRQICSLDLGVQFCVAGAVFAEVTGVVLLLLLRDTVECTFHSSDAGQYVVDSFCSGRRSTL